jgi:AraC family transcriptional regulator, exoenzyme S synthesis regulatory protein ExsA
VFFRKGAFVLPPHYEPDLCILIVFLPDSLVREKVRALMAQLPPSVERPRRNEPALRVNHDVTISAFFASIAAYFAGDASPPETLLKIKLEELLTSILLGRSNPELCGYLRLTACHERPSIPMIMEANFRYNLSLGEFARLCHRSLSTFKREFQKLYATTPKRWLLERRLECAARLLQTPEMNVTEVAFECGFEDASHFCRVFKEKFGHPPSMHRSAATMLA